MLSTNPLFRPKVLARCSWLEQKRAKPLEESSPVVLNDAPPLLLHWSHALRAEVTKVTPPVTPVLRTFVIAALKLARLRLTSLTVASAFSWLTQRRSVDASGTIAPMPSKAPGTT